MKLSEMHELLRFYVDDAVSLTVATSILNAGQNSMAIEVKASFPQLNATLPEGTFIFPEKYQTAIHLPKGRVIPNHFANVRSNTREHG
jgi:hypothetical protein